MLGSSPSSEESAMKYFVGFAVVAASLLMPMVAQAEPLKVMSFNLYHGGDGGKQPLSQSVAVIKAANADVVGLQETTGFGPTDPKPDNSAKLAQLLGWNHLDQGGSTAIITKHKIIATTPRKWGVLLQTASGNSYWMFNAHLMFAPYQPYQLLSIPYMNGTFLKTEAEAIKAAQDTRGGQVTRMLEELQPALKTGLPLFVTGDFNEPSHQDWTEGAAKAKLHPIKVEWPSTKALVTAGLTDSYRSLNRDEVKRPGLTWTPTTNADDPKDHHDRLDFVFFGGKGVKVRASAIVGEAAPYADIVVTPYPSDHRSVVSTFEIGG
ncbi:endonuclease/exonuclease/phosphatase family protein [bacterium]|nr:MAG: endonuclease/exonuclease/phosphatase family protein [bacterium]